MKVIKKRDGRLKEYEKDRIKNAINKANKDVNENIDTELITNEIEKSIFLCTEDIINIEKVQDIVLESLKKYNKKVYNSYKKYREKRNVEREKSSKKEKFYNEILHCTNVDNDNANVDQYSFSGRKYRVADNEQKGYALRNQISKKGKDAFEQGLIYYHDLSSYPIGEANCLFSDNKRLLTNGFRTRNGDVRVANSFSTACQLLAVIFQIQSQSQFGGVASLGIDFELEPFAHKSFVKHFEDGLFEKDELELWNYNKNNPNIHIDEIKLKEMYPKSYDYATRHLNKEGNQSAQALYHNLNTLESRAGSQVPFTSINEGRNTSTYGRLINKWLLEASINGIGKHKSTSIFPISIFQYKKGINDKEGTPNYDLKLKAIESMCKRIYPNWANGDWKQNIEDENDYRTYMGTMGKVITTAPSYWKQCVENQLNC